MSAADHLYPPNEPGLTTAEFIAADEFAQSGDFSRLNGQRPVVVGRARDLFLGRWGQRGGTPRHILTAAEKMGITYDDLREGRT